jgi:hypothetical protein
VRNEPNFAPPDRGRPDGGMRCEVPRAKSGRFRIPPSDFRLQTSTFTLPHGRGCKTKPISSRAIRGASTLWKGSYGKAYMQQASAKQSQLFDCEEPGDSIPNPAAEISKVLQVGSWRVPARFAQVLGRPFPYPERASIRLRRRSDLILRAFRRAAAPSRADARAPSTRRRSRGRRATCWPRRFRRRRPC